MVSKNQKYLIVGAAALGGVMLLGATTQIDKPTGGSSGGFTTTKQALGNAVAPIINYTLPAVNVQEASFDSYNLPDGTPTTTSSKKASNTFQSSSGGIQTAPNSGIYTNPAKATKENIFNPSVPSYTDSLGQGVSVAPTKKVTQPATKKWYNPIGWFS